MLAGVDTSPSGEVRKKLEQLVTELQLVVVRDCHRRAVEQALAGLTLPQRTAVWTTKALDHTLDEAATLMDRAPGTVATHVSRGMVLLRAALAATQQELIHA